jgi:hypothetical protein
VHQFGQVVLVEYSSRLLRIGNNVFRVEMSEPSAGYSEQVCLLHLFFFLDDGVGEEHIDRTSRPRLILGSGLILHRDQRANSSAEARSFRH